jgi:hypothetical protein
VVTESLVSILRASHVQLWWLLGAFCFIGIIVGWGITKGKRV